MLIVHFVEAVQVEDNKTQRRAVAAAAIELFFEGFTEEASVVEAGKGIGNCILLKDLQVVVFNDNRDTEEPCGSEDVHQSGFQRDLTTKIFTQLASTKEHFVPQLDALALAQIEVSDSANVALKELSPRG